MGRVVVELPSPPEPLDACERLAHLPYPLLLDSAADRGRTGRYSYLTADPVEVFQGRVAADPLSAARQALRRFAATPIAELPPFQGGLAGYIAYDYGGAFERLPAPRIDDLEVPDLLLGLYDWVLAWDHLAGRAWVISTGIPEAGGGGERRARHRAAQADDRPGRHLLLRPRLLKLLDVDQVT